MPLARHDNPTTSLDTIALNFYSHASCEAWPLFNSTVTAPLIISTHMPLARHDTPPLKSIVKTVISTHMPLARHDKVITPANCTPSHFYSHASCEAWPLLFAIIAVICGSHFYSHASCEAWPIAASAPEQQRHFYSHASCEAWLIGAGVSLAGASFLLTCLLRGMTLCV